MLHAFWSDYHRFFLKTWHFQLMYWKVQFCCSPGVWHLHAFLEPHRWVFVWTAQPQGGGGEISAASPKKNDKCPIDARGMGTFGIDWAIITSHYGLGELSPLERIITSHYPGELSPLTTPGITWIITPLCREKWPGLHIWINSSLAPFPHKHSGLVVCF